MAAPSGRSAGQLGGTPAVDPGCFGIGAYRAELGIGDNGQGFDPSSISAEHLGLGIIRERTGAVGAELEITRELGSGTKVVVTWQNMKQGAQDE